jgi:hypothetical protein
MPRSEQEIMAELSSLLGGQQAQQPTIQQQPSIPQSGGMVTSAANINGVSMENLDVDKAKAGIVQSAQTQGKVNEMGYEGAGSDLAGRVTLAQEALVEIPKLRKKLFPGGTPQSYNRNLALAANLPGLRVPFFGRLTPATRPDNPFDPTDSQAASDAQSVNRMVGTSLEGRYRTSTGASGREDEIQRLVEQFGPRYTSGDQSAWDALNQLESYYSKYIKNVDPKGAKGLNTQGSVDLTKLSDEELLAMASKG